MKMTSAKYASRTAVQIKGSSVFESRSHNYVVVLAFDLEGATDCPI